jgi:hypothetical protein
MGVAFEQCREMQSAERCRVERVEREREWRERERETRAESTQRVQKLHKNVRTLH